LEEDKTDGEEDGALEFTKQVSGLGFKDESSYSV
jgi:hypothetical protein